MIKDVLKRLISMGALGGVLLFLAAILALAFENSSLETYYDTIRNVKVSVSVGSFSLSKPLLLWVNDGLMAIFFLLVGLELKREVYGGQLSDWSTIALPLFAALGGIVVPALIYVSLNVGSIENLHGWAIPAATDIAFALGVLSLMGSKIPTALRVFLMALAIFDDVAAIVIIAIFYTGSLSVLALVGAGFVLVMLYVLNRMGVYALTPYVLLGIALWIFVLKSGVHATLAGVFIALAIPYTCFQKNYSPLVYLEHCLHSWVAYLVLPLFAFFNAGVSLSGLTFGSMLNPIVLGVALGLFAGKQLGVFAGAWIAVKLKLASLPEGVSWKSLYGVSLLAGIGFTMSLFIGTLAFDSLDNLVAVRIGVLLGSFASGVCGYLCLKRLSFESRGSVA